MPETLVMSKVVAAPPAHRREPSVFYRRMERKLGTGTLTSDSDLARLVEQRLPLTSVDSLTSHGLSDDEIYTYILPRRTLVHRKSKREPLTHATALCAGHPCSWICRANNGGRSVAAGRIAPSRDDLRQTGPAPS